MNTASEFLWNSILPQLGYNLDFKTYNPFRMPEGITSFSGPGYKRDELPQPYCWFTDKDGNQWQLTVRKTRGS